MRGMLIVIRDVLLAHGDRPARAFGRGLAGGASLADEGRRSGLDGVLDGPAADQSKCSAWTIETRAARRAG